FLVVERNLKVVERSFCGGAKVGRYRAKFTEMERISNAIERNLQQWSEFQTLSSANLQRWSEFSHKKEATSHQQQLLSHLSSATLLLVSFSVLISAARAKFVLDSFSA